jgi:glycine/D-amino acid oxidase-like deaminating enzyme
MGGPGLRVCVVGAGAIGTFIGARLSRSGCQVTALARGATAASLRAHVGVPTPNTDALLGLMRVFAEAHHG